MTDDGTTQNSRGQFAKRVSDHEGRLARLEATIAEQQEEMRKLRVACCEFAETLHREGQFTQGQQVQITKALGGPLRGPRA